MQAAGRPRKLPRLSTRARRELLGEKQDIPQTEIDDMVKGYRCRIPGQPQADTLGPWPAAVPGSLSG